MRDRLAAAVSAALLLAVFVAEAQHLVCAVADAGFLGLLGDLKQDLPCALPEIAVHDRVRVGPPGKLQVGDRVAAHVEVRVCARHPAQERKVRFDDLPVAPFVEVVAPQLCVGAILEQLA